MVGEMYRNERPVCAIALLLVLSVTCSAVWAGDAEADRIKQLEAALEVFFREVPRMPEHELAAYRQLPMWQGRIELAPTIPREMALEKTYTFDPDRFSGVRVPTLLLLGEESPRFMWQATEAIDAALSDSRIVVMPGQQHIAMDLDPELFVRAVSSFLRA